MKSAIIGQRIARILKANGYSQSKLAEEIGITQSVISEMLRGHREIDRLINIVASKFNISRDYLVEGELNEISNSTDYENYTPNEDTNEDRTVDEQQTDMILEIYAKSIRHVEDERATLKKEIEEVKKLHDQIDEELMEIKNIKGILWEAIHTFKSTNTDNKIGGLVAADG